MKKFKIKQLSRNVEIMLLQQLNPNLDKPDKKNSTRPDGYRITMIKRMAHPDLSGEKTDIKILGILI